MDVGTVPWACEKGICRVPSIRGRAQDLRPGPWAQAIELKQSAAAAGTSLTWAESLKAGYAEAQLAGDVRQPPLIYSSRTHSQLAQVMRELKRTSYRCCAD